MDPSLYHGWNNRRDIGTLCTETHFTEERFELDSTTAVTVGPTKRYRLRPGAFSAVFGARPRPGPSSVMYGRVESSIHD